MNIIRLTRKQEASNFGMFIHENLFLLEMSDINISIDTLKISINALSKDIDDLKKLIEIPKRAPIGYTLDRTVVPWQVKFDNGSILTLPDYGQTATVYGYGFPADAGSSNPQQYPIPPQIIKTSTGAISIDHWKTSNGAATFYAFNTRVTNPVNDPTNFDFSNAKYNSADTDTTSLSRQSNLIRTFYELNIWTEQDIIAFGAVKQ